MAYRIEPDESGTLDGDVINADGAALGRARLTINTHRRVHEAGTQQEPDAELRGMLRGRARVDFEDDPNHKAANIAIGTNAVLAFQTDVGPRVRFRLVSTTTGEIQIVGVE
jgi:hypothetical protein